MRIAVLTKPVPDTTGQERLGRDLRVDRTTPAVINPNDEHALEAALRLREARGADDEIVLVSMAPAAAPEKIREGLARGANRAVHVTDPALAGACTLSTTKVLAAALRDLGADLVLAGADTSDGRGGVVGAGVAALLGLPYLSYASSVSVSGDGTAGSSNVRIERASPTGHDVLSAPLPALITVTQAVGDARYPTLKGIMGARSKPIETRALGDLGLEPGSVGGAAATTAVLESHEPPARDATRVVRGPSADAAREVVAFLAERRVI